MPLLPFLLSEVVQPTNPNKGAIFTARGATEYQARMAARKAATQKILDDTKAEVGKPMKKKEVVGHFFKGAKDVAEEVIQKVRTSIEEAIQNHSNLHSTPDGQLKALATIVQTKKRQGGRPTPNDKRLATQAKNELRRRRNAKTNPDPNARV